MEHDEILDNKWEGRENEWLPYVKNDVLSIVCCYARYTKGMEELKIFGLKNSLTSLSLASKNSNSSRNGTDDPIYTHTGPLMRKFVRIPIKGCRCNTFNQHYKSENSNQVFNFISEELDIIGNICEILEK